MKRLLIFAALVSGAGMWAGLDPANGLRRWRDLQGELVSEEARVAVLRGEVEALEAEREALTHDPLAIEAAIRSDLRLALPGETIVRAEWENARSPRNP